MIWGLETKPEPDEPEAPACEVCGERCPTMLEEMQANCGHPWSTCFACHFHTGITGEHQAPASKSP